MLLGAMALVVLVFLFIQYIIATPSSQPAPSPGGQTQITAETLETESSDSVTEAGADTEEIKISETTPSSGGMYLRDLPLTEAQRSLAKTFRIDVDTYYLTPETIGCAERELGSERYTAIVGGDTPGFAEATKLLKCL